jgi:glycosyltransferase involved in cell wall biosynthesis
MMLYPYLKTAKECGCKTIMHVREHWPKKEHRIQMMLARNTAKKYADKMVAINHYSASMFPECTSKMSIIYDWIDFRDRYEPRPFDDIFGVDSSKLKVFLFTGGLGHIKGTYDVVQIFTNYIKGEDCRLLIMGPGLDYKLKLAGWKGIVAKMLMLAGWKPYGFKTMEAIGRDSRIVCIPASYKVVDIFKQSYCMLSYFNIPHANLAMAEAIVLGLPVIAAKTEESMEYSDNGKGALLFEFQNKKDFESKIRYVLNNYKLVKEGVNISSDKIKQMFSPKINAEKLNEVCREVVLL